MSIDKKQLTDVNEYLEKVYAGFLGMNIGIRLGAPVEAGVWTEERIRAAYGELHGYVRDYKKFAADDDVNGPVYFLRALRDEIFAQSSVLQENPGKQAAVRLEQNPGRAVTPQEVARAWLNYTREGRGMFWWGGYGISTEHTAYLNLKSGIPAPESGSIRQNGKTVAEQIGGQIFIDTWGLVHPANPEKAAEDAQAAASVSHDGEALCGARFIAACIAAAFTETDIQAVIAAGKQQISEISEYAAVIRAVEAFYAEHPDDWRACRRMLEEMWGYDRYPGACHIIPNAGVCVLAMLYGQGDFSRSVEIAVMCGWDTDCNAGNVGTVLGVQSGIAAIPAHYRRPINDSLILSGISGYLNILDVPSYAKEIACQGLALRGERAPEEWNVPADGSLFFDFALPGSTHGFETSDAVLCTLRHGEEDGGCLKIIVDGMQNGQTCRIFYKPFYTRDEFSDERYDPVLTPQIYSGQTMRMRLFAEHWEGWEDMAAAPYVRTAWDGQILAGGYKTISDGKWQTVTFQVPDTDGRLIDEAGILVTANLSSFTRTSGILFLKDFSVDGPQQYQICIARQKKEFGTITPFAVDHGAWDISGGELSLSRPAEAFAYAGNYYVKDCRITVPVTPINGDSHLLLIRAQGAMRFYAAGLERNRLVIYKNNFGLEKLAEIEYHWINGERYQLTLQAEGHKISLFADGQLQLEAEDADFTYGMYGCGSRSMGRTLFGDFTVFASS